MKDFHHFRPPFQVTYKDDTVVQLGTTLKPTDTKEKPIVKFPQAEDNKMYALGSYDSFVRDSFNILCFSIGGL